MTYGELKKRMIDFGFEESSYLGDEMATSEFQSSVNQARQTIAQYFPMKGRYDFSQDDKFAERQAEVINAIERQYQEGIITEEQRDAMIAEYKSKTTLHRINLKDKTENNASGETVPITFDGVFDNFDKMQVIVDGKVYPFGDYTIEQGYIVVLSYALAGDYTIFFEKGITLIDSNTQDDFDIEIDPEAEHLVPLLASYHAWLDDDMQKAVLYYNEYEQERNNLMQQINERKNQPKARIVGGWKWH